MPHLDDPRVSAPLAPDAARPRNARRAAAVRLGSLLAVLATVGAVFFVGGVIGPDRIRGWVEPLGPFGPLLYVPLSAVLGTFFVPGAVLAAAAGLLFGPWVGAVSAIAAGTLAALLSRGVSGRAGQEAFHTVASERVRAIADLAQRNGFVAVVVARLTPWLPDAPLNHAFGIAGLSALAVAAGHLLAAGPRALAYATIGAHSDDPTGTSSLMGWGLNIATGVVGTILLAYVVVQHRRAGRVSAVPPVEATQE